MSLNSRTVKSVQPGLRGLIASVSEASFASAGGILPAQGTLYGSAEWKTFFGADYRKEFSEFVYLEQMDDTKDGGTLSFGPNKTADEANTPFRTTTRFGNHYWHPILKFLRFVPVSGFPLNSYSNGSIVSAQQYLVREGYIPAATEGTRFVKEEFLSPIPFGITQWPTPQPTAISYHFLGNLRGSFPECLHKQINIDSLIGLIGGSSSGLEGQIFPATNFTEWAPYVISDEQSLTAGGWYRVKITVYPPPQPKIIKTVR